MKLPLLLYAAAALAAISAPLPCPAAEAPGYPLKPVSFERVRLQDSFWLPRLETQRRVLTPYAFEKTEEALSDLRAAARLLAGEELQNPPPPHRFRTSDLFKVMEGAAYLLALERDAELERQMDAIIEVVAGAQEPDGYLNATRTLYPDLAIGMMGDGRYTYVDHSHELYIVGHLYEAAVAYYRATGKRRLLDVADKNAKHVRRVFFEGDPNYNGGKPVMQAPGHQEIELALVRLAEATGDPTHLKTAQRLLDIRGVTYAPDGQGVNSPSYAQQHRPVTQQQVPAGHAVRATYLYSGMADVGAMLGVDHYDQALQDIWRSIVDTRMHITGGLGAVHGIEGFGPEYELPNADAFNETCAAVGNVFFNWRMFLKQQDAKFLDVAELALYNNALAGMNLAGNRFFYVNPLAADGFRPFNHGRPERSPWFGTACCPTNLARLIPQIPGMLFATDAEGLSLCLFAACRTKAKLGGVETQITEETNYPFDGTIRLQLDPKTPARFAVRLRLPTWTTDRLAPGELYRYAGGKPDRAPRLSVNGTQTAFTADRGFAVIEREWSAGDELVLELPMPVRASACRSEVEANHGRLAVSRGPLVYCLESADNQRHAFNYLVRADAVRREAELRDLTIDGLQVTAIATPAESLSGDGSLDAATATLIPYFAWNNRGAGSMAVWLPDNAQTLRDGALQIDDNAQRFASAQATHTFDQDSVQAMIDGRLPKHSFDTSLPRWTSWPRRGEPQTLTVQLKQPTPLRTVQVYWYDDHGGVQVPERWVLEVPAGDDWAPFKLYNTDNYSVTPDQFNVVHPAEPITVERLRLRVWPQPDAAAGVLELVVEPESD
ncbi:Non-reducing end beta-L-arabinofuranosidase [Posidoniimonas corsicana]|uniref:Non-reducing end beta-L-arabinofuranosidase n=1 Tax=Posidoniimonas corsicana TaxID=1938618 RepID=A0A5C5VC69_9BACT|nr:beta-L-arabinofuranosidase domain-containing protein [Posidoniimonas corsicana]TWT36168.1 Non-reducing end beta-L-arabinofuranosidase [Posidoniimonas corsicana]